MYIDKIYTKLYSNKDWNGLEQLVSEIRQFASNPDLTNKRVRNVLANNLRALNNERRFKALNALEGLKGRRERDMYNNLKNADFIKEFNPQYDPIKTLPSDRDLEKEAVGSSYNWDDYGYDREGNPLNFDAAAENLRERALHQNYLNYGKDWEPHIAKAKKAFEASLANKYK